MNEKIEQALNNVEITYKELVEISNNILDTLFKPINEDIVKVNDKINNLSIDDLRYFILKFQLNAYSLSEIKEKASMKAELSDVIQKEQFAIKFNSKDGSATVKEKLALIEVSSETVTKILCNLISNLLKTKLDQLHRLVSALTSVLMSRLSEAKFKNIGIDNFIPQTN